MLESRPIFYQKKEDAIPLNQLTSAVFAGHTRQLLSDGELSIWMCSKGGTPRVIAEGYGEQRIQARKIPWRVRKKIKEEMATVDELTGLNINIVAKRGHSDIRIYLDQELDIGLGAGYVGLSVYNQKGRRPYWEIFLNAQKIRSDNYAIYALLHEIGHALGLEHPHDSSDNDFYQSTVASRSAGPWQTLMSYRNPNWGTYPEGYQANDFRALQELWGRGDHDIEIDSLTSKPLTPHLEAEQVIDIPIKTSHDFLIHGQAASSSIIHASLSNQHIKTIHVDETGDWSLVFSAQYLSKQTPQLGAYLEIEQLDPTGYITQAKPYFVNFF